MSGLARTRGEAVRLQLLGLVYLAVVVGLVLVCVASYRQVFRDHVTVSVATRTAGQQLNVGGDVRMNGAIVGRVSGVEPGDEGGAVVSLQIDRHAAERIPADTVARILPTTLFGQKYVELRSRSAAGDGLHDGDRLAEDTSAETVELTDVLDDLDPLLKAVRPQQLATSLGNLAAGLDGQGARLRITMARTAAYLGDLQPELPRLVADLRLLSRVSGQYADVAPVLLDLARQVQVVSRTVASGGLWPTFLDRVGGAARSGSTLLRASEDAMAESLSLSRPTAELLAEYSPEFLCTIQGFLAVETSSAAQIRDHSFQGYFTLGAQVGGYDRDDRLVLGDLGDGPGCRGLPGAPIPYPGIDLDDGVSPDPVLPPARPGGLP